MNRETEIKAQIADVMQRKGDRLHHTVFLIGWRATGKSGAVLISILEWLAMSHCRLRTLYAIVDQLDELPTLYKIDWIDSNRASLYFSERAMRQVEVIHG